MNKRDIGIIIAAVVVIIAIIVGAVWYSTAVDTCILKVNEKEFSKESFEKFLALSIYEEEQNMTEEELSKFDGNAFRKNVYSSYVDYISYLEAALARGVVLDESVKKEISDYYDGESVDKERLAELGITKEDFMTIYGNSQITSRFQEDITEYYTIQESALKEEQARYPGIDKTYKYRIMQLGYGENEDGTSTKDENKAKIESAYDRVKNGEDFETVAKEIGAYRISIKDGEYKFLSGDQESSLIIYLQQDIANTELYNAMVELNAGEYTSIIDDEENGYYVFARIDEIFEGMTDELLEVLTRDYYFGIEIRNDITAVPNTILVSKVKCPTPELKKEETSNTEGDNSEEQPQGENGTENPEIATK